MEMTSQRSGAVGQATKEDSEYLGADVNVPVGMTGWQRTAFHFKVFELL